MEAGNRASLAGLKVVELARILAGPWIGQTLADLGAEVIKVESPAGDDTRSWRPPFIERPDGKGGTETVAAYFQAANRGKTSVTCDFSNADDLDRVKAPTAESDVVIENFKVGGLKKFGLDYESLATHHPCLIYASVMGFGQNGPRAKNPGYDFLVQGLCGIMDLTGEPDGEPQKVGVAWIDLFTGLYGVIGIPLGLGALAADPAYATNPIRVGNRKVLAKMLSEKTRLRSKQDLIAALEGAGVPGGPINTAEEAIADPQVRARGLKIEPEGLPGLRTPIRFSRSPLVLDKAGPVLGRGAWAFAAPAKEEGEK